MKKTEEEVQKKGGREEVRELSNLRLQNTGSMYVKRTALKGTGGESGSSGSSLSSPCCKSGSCKLLSLIVMLDCYICFIC